jgi:hypothetical protein
MKTTFFVLCFCFLCGTLAVAQAGSSLNSEPQQLSFATHAERASQQPLAQAQDLSEKSSYTYAQGEIPLWEVHVPAAEVPLGDVARMFRKEHAVVKKANVVRAD